MVIAGEEPCARRTLKLIKGGDRVIIHHGPLERLMLESLLLINSETVLRINNNIKKETVRRSADTSWIWFKLMTQTAFLSPTFCCIFVFLVHVVSLRMCPKQVMAKH